MKLELTAVEEVEKLLDDAFDDVAREVRTRHFTPCTTEIYHLLPLTLYSSRACMFKPCMTDIYHLLPLTVYSLRARIVETRLRWQVTAKYAAVAGEAALITTSGLSLLETHIGYVKASLVPPPLSPPPPVPTMKAVHAFARASIM